MYSEFYSNFDDRVIIVLERDGDNVHFMEPDLDATSIFFEYSVVPEEKFNEFVTDNEVFRQISANELRESVKRGLVLETFGAIEY